MKRCLQYQVIDGIRAFVVDVFICAIRFFYDDIKFCASSELFAFNLF
jgi:hypothetical protein